mmetsp:Transcript_24104/g.77373  ORF Transcript_24104/g.77373 Transcript_24104/m.77373 type:complete len:255 (+) Transcript_24104:137-901(+)
MRTLLRVLRGSGQPPVENHAQGLRFADDTAAAATPRPNTNPPAKRRPVCAAAARPCGPRRRAAVLEITATLATTTAEYLSRVRGRICLKPCARPTMTARRDLVTPWDDVTIDHNVSVEIRAAPSQRQAHATTRKPHQSSAVSPYRRMAHPYRQRGSGRYSSTSRSPRVRPLVRPLGKGKPPASAARNGFGRARKLDMSIARTSGASCDDVVHSFGAADRGGEDEGGGEGRWGASCICPTRPKTYGTWKVKRAAR